METTPFTDHDTLDEHWRQTHQEPLPPCGVTTQPSPQKSGRTLCPWGCGQTLKVSRLDKHEPNCPSRHPQVQKEEGGSDEISTPVVVDECEHSPSLSVPLMFYNQTQEGFEIVQFDNTPHKLNQPLSGHTKQSGPQPPSGHTKQSGPKWTSTRVRESFLQFFQSRGHCYISPSPVIPHDDPSLLFVNSGMCQFKKIFEGVQEPPEEGRRLCNSQVSVRLGGKHNDLDVVGRDVYHHTMFEMLGTWSLKGEYDKEQMIIWSLELLLDVWGLDVTRLYFTYFDDGDSSIPPDLETRELWVRHGGPRGVPESHVIGCGVEDNFWSMGESGPCGPCTEVHYDRRGGRSVPELVNKDDPEVLELWNLVFMSWNRVRSSEGFQFQLLPEQHIDTGAGLERVVSVLQEKDSNYDTDIFVPYLTHIEEKWGVRKYTGRTGEEDDDSVDTAYRVVSDHIRTLVFGIVDGGSIGHHGTDHILKMVHRRGCWYTQRYLNGGCFSELVQIVVQSLQGSFPQLQDQHKIDEVLQQMSIDEKQCGLSLKRGEDKLVRVVEKTLKQGTKVLQGKDLFLLHNTFGFSIELIEMTLHELYWKKGIDVQMDKQGFELLLRKLQGHNQGQQKMKKIGKLISCSKTLHEWNLNTLSNRGM